MKLKEIAAGMPSLDRCERIKIAIISDISLEPYITPLAIKCMAEADFAAELVFCDAAEFASGEGEGISGAALAAVILNFQNRYPDGINDISAAAEADMGFAEALISKIRNCASCPILWFGYEDYAEAQSYVTGSVFGAPADRLNFYIAERIANEAVFIDTKRLIAEVGTASAYDCKNKYRWNSPYSAAAIERICRELAKQLLISRGITKKCLVLDCDNVLWGGVISEDGIENIKIGDGSGREYRDFQRFLLSLYRRGVILAVCSKNDESDVIKVFQSHDGMILRCENIACFAVNWDNKADNIRKISDALNIGLDSMVFVDDSDFELNAVKALLPEVCCVKYSRNTVYKDLSVFNLKRDFDLEQVKKRNLTYKTDMKRNALKENSRSYEEYLASLDMRLDIHSSRPEEYGRIAELTQRTNKCTNGARVTADELSELVNLSDFHMYSVTLADRFSDLGLVGALAVKGGTLALFSLSCRALGRGVEDKMLAFAVENHKISEIFFEKSGKNQGLEQKLSTLPALKGFVK